MPVHAEEKKSDNQEINDNRNYYCDHHRIKCVEEPSIETKISDEELKKYLEYLKELD
ncbi:unnamed protein product, partial [Didymodactylos carnosus]